MGGIEGAGETRVELSLVASSGKQSPQHMQQNPQVRHAAIPARHAMSGEHTTRQMPHPVAALSIRGFG